jgi:hypothetical protein
MEWPFSTLAHRFRRRASTHSRKADVFKMLASRRHREKVPVPTRSGRYHRGESSLQRRRGKPLHLGWPVLVSIDTSVSVSIITSARRLTSLVRRAPRGALLHYYEIVT